MHSRKGKAAVALACAFALFLVVRAPGVLAQLPTSISTSQQPASTTVGGSIADKATVTSETTPTGTVTLNLYDNPTCSGVPLFTDTENLVSGSATSIGYTTTATGTYYWVDTYNGDGNHESVTSGCAAEPVIVVSAVPAISTTQKPASTTLLGTIADTATVSGGYGPIGTVTFNLYDNPTCAATPLFTDTEVLVSGHATSAGYTTTATGTDYWVATYNGDSNNDAVTSGCSAEPVVITSGGTSVPEFPPGLVLLFALLIPALLVLKERMPSLGRLSALSENY